MVNKEKGSNVSKHKEPFRYMMLDELLRLFEEVVHEEKDSGLAIHHLSLARKIVGKIKNYPYFY